MEVIAIYLKLKHINKHRLRRCLNSNTNLKIYDVSFSNLYFLSYATSLHRENKLIAYV